MAIPENDGIKLNLFIDDKPKLKYRIIDGINFENLCDDGKELNFNEFYDFLMSNKLSVLI